MRRTARTVAVLGTLIVAVTFAHACSSSTEPPEPVDRLIFGPEFLELGDAREGVGAILNNGDRTVGPISLNPGPATDSLGELAPGVDLLVTPAEIPTLPVGNTAPFSVTLSVPAALMPGTYAATLDALLDGEVLATMAILFTVSPPPQPGLTDSVVITGGPTVVRQGDVVAYTAETFDSAGSAVDDPTLTWSVLPISAGYFEDNRFVGYTPGAARIVAWASGAADTLDITIDDRGLAPGSFAVIGQGALTTRFTSDLWVHGNHAYTGTWNCRSDSNSCGDRMLTWNISNPASPVNTNQVVVDARVVNDVKVRADGAIAVITHEVSNDAVNGVTILGLADPANPTVLSRFTSGLESGVHNVWIEGDYVYVVVDGGGNGMRVLDISDPLNPSLVASFYAGTSFLHDIYVRDGLAFLSHWNAGLVILDVGNGVRGGSPTNPVEVGRLQTAGGETHNAWYWPAKGYVFVGEEDFGTPGVMHVVDASDLANPREVATFEVPGATPHNFWLDEADEIVYLAWYNNGLRALDVSGTLLGALDRQGREIAFSDYSPGGGCFGGAATCSWAPQLHSDGLIYVSDLNTGLWVLQPQF